MEFTGERMIPELNKERLIYAEHLSRYYFASQFVKHKRILDIACGAGYGSHIMALAGATHVVGGDISNEAIDYARGMFQHPAIEFTIVDAQDIPFPAGSFDCIVSFETIEHINNYERFLSEVRRTITETGMLIISSPNKAVYPAGNEYHVREFTRDEFVTMLEKEFANVIMLSQSNFVCNSLYTESTSLEDNNSTIIDNLKADPHFFVALCSNGQLPTQFKTSNFISEPSEIVSRKVLSEREHHIEILKQEVENFTRVLHDKDEITKDREQHIEILKQDLNDRLFNISELNKRIEDLLITKEMSVGLNESLSVLREQLKSEGAKNDYIYSLLAEKDKQNVDLLHEIQKVNNVSEELKNYQIEQSNTIFKLQNEVMNLEKDIIEKNVSLGRIGLLEKDLHSEIQKSEYLFSLKNDFENRVAILTTQLSFEQQVTQQLKQGLSETEKKLVDEINKANYLFGIKNDKEAYIRNLEEQIKEVDILKRRIHEFDDIISNLNKEKESNYALLSVKDALISNLNLQNAESKDAIRQLKDTVADNNTKLGILIHENKSLSDDRANLSTENTRLISENNEQRSALFGFTSRDIYNKQIIEQQTSEIISKQHSIEQCHRQMLKYSLENSQLDFELKTLTNTIISSKATIAELQRRIEQVTTEAAISKQYFATQAELVASQQAIIADFNQQLLVTLSELGLTRNELGVTRNELDLTRNELHERDNTINELHSSLLSLENERDKLHQEISSNNEKILLLENDNMTLERKKYETEQHFKAITDSLSWKITLPLRWLLSAIVFLSRPLSFLTKDTLYAFQLLKREGVASFISRFFWYLRGKRLIEEIQFHKNGKKLTRITLSDDYKPIEFPHVKQPEVSIIIPVYNQWKYTYNCLQSIHENSADVSYEIIIADDVSSDETVAINDVIKNITVIRNKTNQGFLLNCNNAAKKARGTYILFLNNDTKVHPGWLGHLRNTFQTFDKVGAVGGKLVYEDGRLQEAGGIIWDDASGWNFGRLGDPQMPEFNYAKEVDYVSGACLMVSKHLWKQIGGFDLRYVPAYYEDTDLAFEIRRAGYKVMYQPYAIVTHFEGVSNGTDLSSGMKKYQVDNNKKFLEKWRETLSTQHFKNAENVFLARDRSRFKKTVLIIDHYVPHFDKDAGSRSTFSYIKLLVKMGYNVKFIGDNFFRHEPYTTEVEKHGIEVLCGNYYYHNITTWLKDNGKYIDYVFAHRLHIGPKYFIDLKNYTKAKVIYIPHDLQFVKSLKEFELTNDHQHKKNSEKFKMLELDVFNTVDIIYPFSTVEEEIIKKLVPQKIVKALPVYFFDEPVKNVPPFSQRRDILFVGGFGHPPNIDAVLWFVNEVFPLVSRSIPGIVLNVVGSNPPKEILNLKSDSVNVTGYVSDEDLVEFYRKCRISVLPLRVGAGVKGKLLEAMYHRVPTVITPVAAEGVYHIDSHSIIASTPAEFAKGISRLYNDEKAWIEYSKKGNDLIHNNYTELNAQKILEQDIK